MKHLVSIPSTKPQEFLYTDFSLVSPYDHPKLPITRIINYIKNVLKMRVYLCFRDIEQLYKTEAEFFDRIMNTDCAQQLWKKINKNDDETLQQRQIISLLTKIILNLTKQKNEHAENKRFDKFAEVKYTIDWLEDRIVEMETLIRDKVKQVAVRKRTESQFRRKMQFQEKAEVLKEQLESTLVRYETELMKRHKREEIVADKYINERVERQKYVYRPSKHLSEAKDQSLLAKLAPYKSEKKRPFECKSLQNQLSLTAEKGKQHTQKQIEEFKNFQKLKIKKRHLMQRQVFLAKLQDQNNQTLAKLQQKRTQLNKSQNIKMQKLIETNNKLAKERVESLRKSLRAYSMRDQTRQVGRIVKHHRETIQFVNNIEDIADTASHGNHNNPNYVTLDVKSDWSQNLKANRYSNERLESKIIRRIKNQSLLEKYDEDGGLGSGRKSLVNLYDDELKEV